MEQCEGGVSVRTAWSPNMPLQLPGAAHDGGERFESAAFAQRPQLNAVSLGNRRCLVPGRSVVWVAWWGYDALQVDDPDGNELLFPRPD